MERKQKSVAIIGAGLAGCSVAYELSKNNHYSITIFEKHNQVAAESSGNYAGILRPYITNDNNYAEQFHTLGYKLLLDFINNHKSDLDICSKGVVHLLSNPKEYQRYTKIFKNRDVSTDVAQLLTADETSKLLRTNTEYSAIFYPNALSIIPRQLCQLWLELSKAKLVLDFELQYVEKLENDKWQLKFNNQNVQEFDIVIFAGAYYLFDKISYLRKIPVYPSQGQLTLVENLVNIDMTVMDKGYIIPNYNSKQVVGATFRKNNDTLGDIRDEDTQENLQHLEEIFHNENISQYAKVLASRVATRCVTSDHLPLVGQLVDYKVYEQVFYKPLSKGYPKSKMPKIEEYKTGLYLSSGFGSKGLCSSLISAKVIAGSLGGESVVSDKLLEALAPYRFWLRLFKKELKLK